MDREKLAINEKSFMVNCVKTATLIVDNNVYKADKKTVYVETEKRARLILEMALAFYTTGGAK